MYRGGRDIGSQSVVYHSSMVEVAIGIVQILLHQLSSLCDPLLIERRLPDTDEIDRVISNVWQIDAPPINVPAVTFEKFFEMYRLYNNCKSIRFTRKCITYITCRFVPDLFVMSEGRHCETTDWLALLIN